MLKEVSESQLGVYLEAGSTLSQVAVCRRKAALLVGVGEEKVPGSIRSYRLPVDGEFLEFQAHAGPCTRLCISADATFLFSASSDGSLYVFALSNSPSLSLMASAPAVLSSTGSSSSYLRSERDILFPYTEEILVTRRHLQEKKSHGLELEREVDDLRNQLDFQLRNQNAEHREKIANLHETFTQELENERRKYEVLQEEKNEAEQRSHEAIRDLHTRHAGQLQTTENNFQRKLMMEVTRYQTLNAAKETLEKDAKQKLTAIILQHQEEQERKEKEAGKKINALTDQLAELQNRKSVGDAKNVEMLKQVEEDTEREYQVHKASYEERLAKEREENVRLRGQAGIYRKHQDEVKATLMSKDDELRHKDMEIASLKTEIDKQLRDLEVLNKEIRERNQTVAEKDRRLFDARREAQVHEKYKVVLNHEIKELKSAIAPKEQEIEQMNKHMQSMSEELRESHLQNKKLSLDVVKLQLKLQAMQAECQSLRHAAADENTAKKRLAQEMHDCVQKLQDYKSLKESVLHVYRRYSSSEQWPVAVKDSVATELTRHRDYLENTVQSLKTKLAKDSQLHRQDNLKLMQENVSLIREINELRREIVSLKKDENLSKIKGNADRATRRTASNGKSATTQ
eukprot:GHVT01023304.1.p1 GENE.GHVT01023304.1~~GHVT01023304.1.p1  ORF type:complete len:628 (+),score=105.56 GHVT01023304.1:452-2335(+)